MNEYSYVVDSNIFLRTLIKEDEKTFSDCFRFLEQIKRKNIRAFTSSFVLAEVTWTLLSFYHFPKEQVVKGLYSIVNLKNLKIIDTFDAFLAMKLYERNPIKFIDALLASHILVVQGKAKIISYDRDFDKLKVPRIEPRELVQRYVGR